MVPPKRFSTAPFESAKDTLSRENVRSLIIICCMPHHRRRRCSSSSVAFATIIMPNALVSNAFQLSQMFMMWRRSGLYKHTYKQCLHGMCHCAEKEVDRLENLANCLMNVLRKLSHVYWTLVTTSCVIVSPVLIPFRKSIIKTVHKSSGQQLSPSLTGGQKKVQLQPNRDHWIRPAGSRNRCWNLTFFFHHMEDLCCA